MAKRYYAVIIGEDKKIYDSYDAYKDLIIGVKDVKHKGFKTKKEALAFLDGKELNEKPSFNKPTCFIDGSYDVKTDRYSFGGVFIINGSEIKFKKSYEPDEYSSARNVAGEIKGAAYVMQYCINHNIKEIDLCYDYKGIECWYTGAWKANTPIALSYVNFVQSIRGKLKINFVKIKSHTNDYYNDMADMLAKEALGL